MKGVPTVALKGEDGRTGTRNRLEKTRGSEKSLDIAMIASRHMSTQSNPTHN